MVHREESVRMTSEFIKTSFIRTSSERTHWPGYDCPPVTWYSNSNSGAMVLPCTLNFAFLTHVEAVARTRKQQLPVQRSRSFDGISLAHAFEFYPKRVARAGSRLIRCQQPRWKNWTVLSDRAGKSAVACFVTWMNINNRK